MPSVRRTVAVVVTTVAMVLGLVGAAQAGGYDEGAVTEGLFYGNFDEDVLLFSGGTAADFCSFDEPTHEARVFHREDGSTDIKVDGSEQPIYLYATDLGAPEFLDATCPAPPQPFAEGRGTVRMRLTISPEGVPVRIVNSTVGSASAADGTTWHVRGWADLTFVDGVLQGGPEDFQGLHIAETGA